MTAAPTFPNDAGLLALAVAADGSYVLLQTDEAREIQTLAAHILQQSYSQPETFRAVPLLSVAPEPADQTVWQIFTLALADTHWATRTPFLLHLPNASTRITDLQKLLDWTIRLPLMPDRNTTSIIEMAAIHAHLEEKAGLLKTSNDRLEDPQDPLGRWVRRHACLIFHSSRRQLRLLAPGPQTLPHIRTLIHQHSQRLRDLPPTQLLERLQTLPPEPCPATTHSQTPPPSSSCAPRTITNAHCPMPQPSNVHMLLRTPSSSTTGRAPRCSTCSNS